MALIEFENNPSDIYSPTLDAGTLLYGRVLFGWSGTEETILTTAPAPLMFGL